MLAGNGDASKEELVVTPKNTRPGQGLLEEPV